MILNANTQEVYKRPRNKRQAPTVRQQIAGDPRGSKEERFAWMRAKQKKKATLARTRGNLQARKI